MIRNPVIPFVGHIGGHLASGNTIRIQGITHPGTQRFALNLQCGPNINPRDDVALHISPDFNRNCIVRNNILQMNWGPEEAHGHFPLMRGQPFDLMILCEPHGYKIAINGQHYTVFEHRIPYNRVTHFAVDGDVSVTSIEFGGGLLGGPVPMPMSGGMPMPGAMPMHGQMPMSGPYMPSSGYPVGPGYPGGPGQYPGGGMMGPMMAGGLAGAALTGHLSPKKALKSQKKAHKKALKYGLPLAGVGLGAYAVHKMGHHHHGHSSSSSSSSSSSEEE